MKSLLLSTALIVGASVANAATVDLDFGTVISTNQSSVTYGAGTLSVTVTGISCAGNDTIGDDSCAAADIDEFGFGIGMYQGGLDNPVIDGWGSNEFLQLSFSQDVTLDELNFTFYNESDDFEFFTAGATGGWNYEGQFDACESGCGRDPFVEQTYTFDTPFTGMTFIVGAVAGNDNWQLSGLTTTYVELAAVPLPAAGWLMLAGLGGIAATRRRKSA